MIEKADSTAVRVALWRALHLEVDPPPHIIRDEVGLKLASPDEGWRSRPDMHPEFTKAFRASIVGRGRLIEDLVEVLSDDGVEQYVILGAGLDTFAIRRPELASKLRIYEVDQPGHQKWKQKRVIDLGYKLGDWHRFVPVNFEEGDSWIDGLIQSGFDVTRPAVISSAGVSMYLTREAIISMFGQIAKLAPKSCFIMTFLLPIEMADPELQPIFKKAENGARSSGTPFISYFTPQQMIDLVKSVGFRRIQHVSTSEIAERYFSKRTDGLRPPDNSEEFIIVTV